jgi:transposase-like protein
MIKSIKTASVKSRRKFDETFKREAVQNWLNSGKSAEVVAEELGLTASLLYAWRKLVRRRWGESDGGQAGFGGRSSGCRSRKLRVPFRPAESG